MYFSLGKLMDLIGRKKLLIAANFLSLVGWTVIVCAPSVIVICVGRFLGGVAVAAITLTGKQPFLVKKILLA
jgi:MFS family permease